MFCEYCGAEVEADMPFCPECGREIKSIPLEPLHPTMPVPPPAPAVHAIPSPPQEAALHPKPASSLLIGVPGWVWFLAASMLVTCVLLIFISAGLAGIYRGLQERARINRQTAATHYDRGITHLEAGELELAIAEFEQALRLYPDYPEAQDKLRQARALAEATPTPTPSLTPERTLDVLYEQAKSLHEQGRWEEAAQKLSQLRQMDPLYKPAEVEDMLFSAYYTYAQELVDENRFEMALRYFDNALAIRPEDARLSQERQQASLYLSGLDYWNADWGMAVEVFARLYQLAPDYKDVAQRLYEAHVNYGDYLGEQGAWCSAQKEYASALVLQENADAQRKQQDAFKFCQMGTTPTPPVAAATPPETPGQSSPAPAESPSSPIPETPPPSPTETETPTPAIEPPSGKIAFSVQGPDLVGKLYMADASGSGQTLLITQASQPNFSRDGTKVAFRSLLSDQGGIHAANIDGSGEMRVSYYVEDSFPAWSPDSKSIVFASNRAGDRRWRIYLAWPGKPEAADLGLGQAPAWTPDGRIVFRGCNPQGGDCGLFIMGADGSGRTRLTSNESDTIPACSPDGTKIAFTSARTGNWDIYLMDSGGGEARQLTDNPTSDGLPAWSPDGNYIAFLSDRDGTWGIYIMRADGSEQRKFITIEGSYQDWLSERISWAR